MFLSLIFNIFIFKSVCYVLKKSSRKNKIFNKCDPFNTFLTLKKPLIFYNILFLKEKVKKDNPILF